MATAKKNVIEYRCPLCLSKEVDVPMLYDSAKNEYYCIKCCYVGGEQAIHARYAQIKSKYKRMPLTA